MKVLVAFASKHGAWASRIASELAAIGADLGADTRNERSLPAEQHEEAHVLEGAQ